MGLRKIQTAQVRRSDSIVNPIDPGLQAEQSNSTGHLAPHNGSLSRCVASLTGPEAAIDGESSGCSVREAVVPACSR